MAPTFAEAIVILKQDLKWYRRRETRKPKILEKFTGEVEDCPLCQANLKYGKDKNGDNCPDCPASFSHGHTKNPCTRVVEARKRYVVDKIRKNYFIKVFSEALKETEKNFRNKRK